MNEKDFIQHQASLDQSWKSIEENINTLKQIHDLMAEGLIKTYLGVLLAQASFNIIKRINDA